MEAFESTGWERSGVAVKAAGGPQAVVPGAYALNQLTYIETVYEVNEYVEGTTNYHPRNLTYSPQSEPPKDD